MGKFVRITRAQPQELLTKKLKDVQKTTKLQVRKEYNYSDKWARMPPIQITNRLQNRLSVGQLLLLIVLLLAFVAVGRSQEILANPFSPSIQELPPNVRSDFDVLARRTWSVIQEMFGAQTVANVPIYWQFKNAGNPINRPDDCRVPTWIMIDLSAKTKPQFVYQFSHELTHQMFSPCLTNGIIETICIASSYEALERIATKWPEYAADFRPYAALEEWEFFGFLPTDIPYNMPSALARRDWNAISRYLGRNSNEIDQISCNGDVSNMARAEQSLAAIAIRSDPITWSEFLKLRDCFGAPTSQGCLFVPFRSDCLRRSSQAFCRFWTCPWH